MNASHQYISLLRRGIALVAIVFGLATLIAGGGVLGGSDPGYTVLLPLLIFNTVMGFAYVAAGVTIWRGLAAGRYVAATIFLVNLLVLRGVGYLYATGSGVAIDSVRAMVLRTVVWLGVWLGVVWTSRREHARASGFGSR